MVCYWFIVHQSSEDNKSETNPDIPIEIGQINIKIKVAKAKRPEIKPKQRVKIKEIVKLAKLKENIRYNRIKYKSININIKSVLMPRIINKKEWRNNFKILWRSKPFSFNFRSIFLWKSYHLPIGHYSQMESLLITSVYS